MSGRLGRVGLAAVVTAGAALSLGGGSAAADPAGHSSFSTCYSYSGYTTCYTTDVIYKTTVTPSGNQQYWAHGTSTYTSTGPGGYSYSSQSKYAFRYFYKDGVPFVYGDNSKGSYSYNGITCTYKYVFRYVNGEYRVEHSDTQCAPTT